MKARVRKQRPMTQKELDKAIKQLHSNTKEISDRMYYQKQRKNINNKVEFSNERENTRS